MIFIPFCGVPTPQKNATIFYKMTYYKISLIKVVNKGSKSLFYVRRKLIRGLISNL
jgi:hypothetical protein